MAGNLGYDTFLVSDATATFNKTGLEGQNFSADLIHETSLASLNDEFATIVTTDFLKQILENVEKKSERRTLGDRMHNYHLKNTISPFQSKKAIE